jgi:hypothetical protein
MVKPNRAFWICCVTLFFVFAGAFSWLAFNGYIFPLRYVEYDYKGRLLYDSHRIRHHFGSEWVEVGKCTSYYFSGNKQWEGENDYNGKPLGKWIYYFEDGSIKEIDEHENGALKRVTHYNHGIPGRVVNIENIPAPKWVPDGYPVDDTREGVANWELRLRMSYAYEEMIKEGVKPSDAFQAVNKEFDPQWQPRPKQR